ncbi:MAG: hypothetical protein WBP61_07305, partial [Nocardioides sp.]
MTTTTIVIIAIVVIVAIAIGVGAYVSSRRRRHEQKRHRAGQLRSKAAAQTGAVDGAQQEAAAAQARAETA